MASGSLLGSPLVKDLVTCAICSRFLDQPKILPCQHSFCFGCLSGYFDQKEIEARRKLMSIRCPECFTPTAIPLGGIDFFPSDHRADKIKTLLQDMMMHNILRTKQHDLEGGRPRSGSKSRPHSFNLENIDLNTIAAEQDIGKTSPKSTTHSLNKTMPVGHVGLDMYKSSTKEAGTNTLEDIAPNKPNKLQDCGIQTEAEYDVTPSGEFDTEDEGYDTLSVRKRRTAKTAMNNSIYLNPPQLITTQGYRKEDKNVNTPTTPTLNRPVSEEASQSKCSSQEGPRATHTTYNKPGTNQYHSDSTQQCNNSNMNSAASHAVNMNHRTRSSGTSSSENVHSKPSELNNNNCNGINENDVLESNKMEAETNGDVFTEDGSYMNGSQDNIDGPEKVYKKDPCMIWSVEKNERDMPTDIVVTPNGGITVTDYGNCRIQYFESSGEYVHSIDNVKPFAIAFDKTTDTYVVADRKNKSLKVFDQGGGIVTEWENNSFHWVCGLAVTKMGEYVVFDRELTKIGVYNQEGVRLSEFGSYGDGDSHLCMADFLTVDSHDRIIVCDSGHHCIKLFDTRGSFLGRFSGRGTGPGQLLWPKSVTVDASDNILVTDQRNNRISLFSPDGHFIQHVLPNCPNPYNLSLNQKGILGVTSYGLGGSSSISVYQL